MKKLLLVLFCLAGLAGKVTADDTVALSTDSVQLGVVELHITEKAPVSSAEAKQRKRRLATLDAAGRVVCSGAFIDDMGDIITAGHCLEDAESVEVVTYDGRRYAAIGIARSENHDLGLMHIDRRDTPHFLPARSVERGEKVYVLGSPLAISDTLSTGIIAKLDGDHVLIDCSVLPGNSGSPVFDEEGRLVGVATAVFIVGFGTTHLSIVQGLDAMWFFIMRASRGGR